MSGTRIEGRDWLLGVGVAATLVVGGLAERPAASGSVLLGYTLLALAGLALTARRRAPVTVLVVTGLCTVAYQATGFTVFAVAYLVAVYAAMRAGRRLATGSTSLLMLVALPAAAIAAGRPAAEAFAQARAVLGVAWLVAAAAAGEALRQALRQAEEAERTREQAALRRAGEERLHIARELHDTLTHQISVIKVQAEAAVHLAQKRGEPVPEALLVIRDAGREAARELRATLEALRDDDRLASYGLGQLTDLVERARATGLDVSLTVDGRRDGLPAAVDRTAYRIVQEALTNVARHAGATSASVRIGHHPGLVTVRVDDDGSATPQTPPVPGVGLLGMRERVTALGGSLCARPRPEGGFRVSAELPVEQAS
ncbi:sensor histidine kinase [Actinoplanes siamensis]|nr:sensor histidine kinase [Actinoplanes siamensis]